jgi:hypothetical protein
MQDKLGRGFGPTKRQMAQYKISSSRLSKPRSLKMLESGLAKSAGPETLMPTIKFACASFLRPQAQPETAGPVPQQTGR